MPRYIIAAPAFCDSLFPTFQRIFAMSIATEATPSAHIVTLQGQLNSANAASVEADILGLVDGGARQLVLNFSPLDYISSAGLRVVLVLAKRLKAEGGKLVLFGMQPHVREVFDISGFLAILNVQPGRVEALAQF
ncbi:STAS domain-containing protein [Melaminivora jejuensis]